MAESPKAPRKTAAKKTSAAKTAAKKTTAPRGSATEADVPAGANQDTQAGRAAAKQASSPAPSRVATTTADAGDAGHRGGDADGAEHHRTPSGPVTAPDAPEVDLAGGSTIAARRADGVDVSDVPTEERAATTADAGVAGREGDTDEAHLPPASTVQAGIDYAAQARSSAAPLAAPGAKASDRSHAWGVEPVMMRPEVTAGKTDVVAAPSARLHPDYHVEQYVDDDGNKITSPAGVFDESGTGTLVKVKKGVWEDVLPRNAKTMIRRRVFAAGQEVPRNLVEQFKGDVDDRDLII